MNRFYKLTGCILLFTFITIQPLSATSTKSFEAAVHRIIKAFENKDEATINSFIHPEKGIVFIWKIGVGNTITFQQSFEYGNNAGYHDFEVENPPLDIQYEELPYRDCEIEQWTKPDALYCDTLNRDHSLTRSMRFLLDFNEAKPELTEAKYQEYLALEEVSHRIVCLSNPHELVFNLTFLEGRWYLTIIETDTWDCGA